MHDYFYSLDTRKYRQKLAELKSAEDAMVFPTGYSANVGIVSALMRPTDVVVLDKLNHASIVINIDDIRVSLATSLAATDIHSRNS